MPCDESTSERLQRIEDAVLDVSAKLDRLLMALADEADEEEPQRTLDGEDGGGERDQSQPL